MCSTVFGKLKSLGNRPSSPMCGKTRPYLEVGLICALARVAARFVLFTGAVSVLVVCATSGVSSMRILTM